MSGTFPSTPAPSRLRLRTIQPSRVSQAHSMKRQSRTTNAQRFAISLEWAPQERDDFAPIFAFIMKQRGRYDTFQYVLPRPLKSAQGTLGGTLRVNNNAVSPTGDVQTGRALFADGATGNITGWGKAMDVFKFAGHSKVYMLTADSASDSGGNVTLNFDPALVESPADNEIITFTDVPFTVALANDDHEFNLEPGPFFGFTLDLIEAY